MKNILVAVDFSPCTRSLINHSLEIAKALDGKIHLVHVVGSNTDSEGRYRLDSDEQFPDANEALRKLICQIKETGIDTDGAIIEGQEAHSIIEEAKQINADLIIMGTHGHSVLGGALVNSASQSVLRHTTVPVYYIPVKH